MSTTRASKATPFVDGKFAKRFIIVCCAVPFVLLLWDAYQHQLGVNSVNFAIRTTGLLGIICLTLALAITPLRRLTKWNTLISIRRNLGVFGFFYITVHFLIFFVFDRDLSVGSTLHEIVTRVYLWFGTGALVLMIPLAITSTDGMVTRLGAKRWKLLHRLTYAVVLFGVIHYYLLVKADTTAPFAFAVAFGALMALRIAFHYVDLHGEVAAVKTKLAEAKKAVPQRKKFWSGELKVARIFHETHDVKTFRFVSPDGGPLPFEHIAGQYLNLKLVIDGKRVNRSYTIASSPTRQAYCEISVKRAANGYGSKHLHETWREGQLVKVSAPAGKFYFAGSESDRVVLIAGGIGITPMMSVVRSLTDRGWTGDMYLLFSVRLVKDVVFADELAYLQARFPNLKVKVTVTNDPDTAWDGARGQITREMLQGFVPDLKRGPVMLCGPDKMMTAMRELLVGIGISDAEIHQEA
ncbi:MAG TPA: ferric reductase-like transmembrane domain-containing protein, partial [Kofleriaceae bacterium]|nr:ferric reductase-like transmembrane domain-containing protein [Kofleriaceae bacterium]